MTVSVAVVVAVTVCISVTVTVAGAPVSAVEKPKCLVCEKIGTISPRPPAPSSGASDSIGITWRPESVDVGRIWEDVLVGGCVSIVDGVTVTVCVIIWGVELEDLVTVLKVVGI